MDLICSNPQSAGKRLQSAIQAGGQQAEVWAFALFQNSCPDPSPPSTAYSIAIDTVNPSGDPADLPTIEK
jgi:hypothetical protein